MKRPSPALIIACVALFLSLGGVSYGVASGFIDSREIKNNTIRSKDIRNGQVTGADVKEASLAKVPSAGSADSAGTANSANTASTAGNAAHATTASNAANADAVGGVRERADQRAAERGHALRPGLQPRRPRDRDGVRCARRRPATSTSASIRTLANAEAVRPGLHNPGAGPDNVEDYSAQTTSIPVRPPVAGAGYRRLRRRALRTLRDQLRGALGLGRDRVDRGQRDHQRLRRDGGLHPLRPRPPVGLSVRQRLRPSVAAAAAAFAPAGLTIPARKRPV